MTNGSVRYGIISTANIAIKSHIPAAHESLNSDILAISSRSEAKAKLVAEEHHIPTWYGTYEDLLVDPNIDAVINALPNSMHCEWTVKAAEAGKHILCEKPLAVTTDEARKMIDAANQNGVVLVEAFTHRWNNHLRSARKLIAEGAIGRLTNLQSIVAWNITEREGDIRFSPELAGGIMMDGGCYGVYACRFVLGKEPIKASGFAYDSGSYGVDTTFDGLIEFPDGEIAYIHSSMDEPTNVSLTAIGTEGIIEIPEIFNDSGPLVIKTGDEEIIEAVPTPSRYLAQINEFSECILTGKAPEFPAEDGLANTAALVALLSSARNKTVEDIEQTDYQF